MDLHKSFYKKHSLSSKITALIVVTACILGLLAVGISFRLYCDKLEEQYERQCNGMLNVVEQRLNPDELTSFLEIGTETDRYLTVKRELEMLLNSFPDLTYLYVYKIDEEGCHVILDCDTPELSGEPLGTVLQYDDTFVQYLDELCAGASIPPITSNDQYGWLLTVYRSIYDSDGNCVAYAGVDVSMEEMRAERYIFIIRIISLLTGATLVIAACAILFAQRRIIAPINELSLATSDFVYNTETAREKTAERMRLLHIKTGDEIENLSNAVTKMMADVVQYIARLNEQSREIASNATFIEAMQDNIILTFADMIENRDESTGNHVRHTAAYVRIVGEKMLQEGVYPDILTSKYLEDMVKSAPLHDVGKIRVSDVLLNKPGRLTPEEFETIKQHTIAGRNILQEALHGIEGGNYLARATEMAAWHHEKWDGSGYPDGLSGTQIPLCARVMAVADVFDALVSYRSYKEPCPFDQAITIIRESSGTHFDPFVTDAFLASLPAIKQAMEA